VVPRNSPAERQELVEFCTVETILIRLQYCYRQTSYTQHSLLEVHYQLTQPLITEATYKLFNKLVQQHPFELVVFELTEHIHQFLQKVGTVKSFFLVEHELEAHVLQHYALGLQRPQEEELVPLVKLGEYGLPLVSEQKVDVN